MVHTTTTSATQASDDGALDHFPSKVVENVENDFLGLESGLDAEDAAICNESAPEAPDAPARKLYLVRVPRPPIDNAVATDKTKKLVEDFQAHVAKIKKINDKVKVKRDEWRELRKQMQAARSLKGESQPEFDEKLTRIKQLQEMRNTYQKKMFEIKDTLKGLDCKSEDQLDAKIRELEGRISHSHMELKEEKILVRQIATMRGQREIIKAYETQKVSLGEMEAECANIKAAIGEMDGEFSILKGERDSAQKIISDIHARLLVAEEAMKEEEKAQAEAVIKKNDALEKLDKARDAANAGMKPYRENRSFSLKIRDMVAAGQVEEAFALCEAQVSESMTYIESDKAYRTNYSKLWADQRKTPVAEILPESCSTASARPSGRGGKGLTDGPRIVANGAEKAKALIANLLQQASVEVAVKREEQSRMRAAEPVRHDDADADDEEDDKVRTPGEILTDALEAASKKAAQKSREDRVYISNPVTRAAEVSVSKVEVPDVVRPVFELPKEAAAAAAAAELSKEQVREEQRLKAKEGEERKKRKEQQAEEKKVKAAERAKQAEADAKAAAVAVKVAEERKATIEEAATAAAQATKEAAAAEAETAALPAVTTFRGSGPAPGKAKVKNIYAKTTTVAVAKHPANKGLKKQLKKLMEQNRPAVVIGALGLLVILLIIASLL